MNNYTSEVLEILKKSDIHEEYYSFISKTLNDLAITRNEEHLTHILGTPDEFVAEVLANNSHYIPSENYQNKQVSLTADKPVEKDKKSKKAKPKGFFFGLYNKTIMLVYKVAAIIAIIMTFKSALMVILLYHSYEVNVTLIALYFAFLAFLALFGLILEAIRDSIYFFVKDKARLSKSLIKLLIWLILIVLSLQLMAICFDALQAYVPSVGSLSSFDPITNFFINLR